VTTARTYATSWPLGRALYSPVLASAAAHDQGHPNVARYHFLDPGTRDFYADWEAAATTIVALLRAEAGRNPCDADLRGLVSELSAASPDFRTAGRATTSCCTTRAPRPSGIRSPARSS
jgi:hypothetical protein